MDTVAGHGDRTNICQGKWQHFVHQCPLWNCKIHLSKFWNIFSQILKCTCPNCNCRHCCWTREKVQTFAKVSDSILYYVQCTMYTRERNREINQKRTGRDYLKYFITPLIWQISQTRKSFQSLILKYKIVHNEIHPKC